MKEPVALYTLDRLEYSQEILLYREPKELSLTIWVIVSLFVAVICWIVFGKMEETVRAKGIVRPVSNISQVKNAVSGEITGLYYRPAERVEKDALLLKINSQVLEAKEAALKTNLEKLIIKINGLQQIEKSFYMGITDIDKSNTVALTRFQAYAYQRELLEKRYAFAEKTWQEALRMPKEAITPVKLRELEYEKNIQQLNLETHNSTFIKDISGEYVQSIVELEDLKSQIEQVRQNLKNTSVYAPIAGTVQELASLNKNDYLFADQKILNIVPDDGNVYKAELKIPAKMSGKLEKGMKVKLRFPAFPFHEFGGAVGTITAMDPDASADNSGALYFTVSVNIDKSFLEDKKKRSYPIKSGLEVESRIILKEQTILWYILKKLDMVW
ncbi:HlyD family efflux transporter periplasmic adaptor subunit [Treponema sp. Marseille-Q4523]|uniref:HlyD family efflux transporter periplasmic adaptor subunit n=1 Tax=Treponema sp. Marseille-Q4523 TaxID=2810610 RepID=UPI001960320B|nr:HlyD family efflux transporter periplasmic adaptor subunit [Treponema sp. Marseille-Q4523]MBM7022318.1 HlyD family efflux transporter periplasmic adaptor subunit [Treponema sp. Marseille-Q4523]